jgi:hypothetical protein
MLAIQFIINYFFQTIGCKLFTRFIRLIQRQPTQLSGLLIVLIVTLGGCSESPIPQPTSSLKPEQVEELTEEKQLAKKMFSSILKQLPNGTVGTLIIREKPTSNRWYLKLNPNSEKTLHELCEVQDDCIGGVYASVYNDNNQGEILYRIHQGKKMQIACAWLERYPSPFETMNKQLQQDIIGRMWHWANICFD